MSMKKILVDGIQVVFLLRIQVAGPIVMSNKPRAICDTMTKCVGVLVEFIA